MRQNKKYTFLETYRNNKKSFIKPKLYFYFGSWRNEGNLPVWRRGNIIRFGKNTYKNGECINEYEEKWNYACLEDSYWTEIGKKNHPILSKFLKPSYMLPIWLSFYLFNSDIHWKTKWYDDDFNYEFPSHFTIVFFGLAFSITAYIPKKDEDDWLCNDQYWESMLAYEYYNGDLKKTNDCCGWYDKPGEDTFRFKFDPRFLRNEDDRNELIAIQNEQLLEIIKKYEEEDKERQEKKCYAIYADVRNAEPNKDGNYVWDGWHKVLYKRKTLVYKTKEDCQNVLDNINKNVERKKGDVLKHIEYKMYIGDKDEFIKWNSLPLYIDEIIDKNVDMFNGICKLI